MLVSASIAPTYRPRRRWRPPPAAPLTSPPPRLAVIFFFLPLKRVSGDYKSKFKQIDYLGCLLTLGGCSMIVLPLNWGGTSFAWTSPQVLGCLIGGFATFVVFFFWEGSRWARIPVVPPRIFRDRTVMTVMQCTFLSGMTVLGQSYYVRAHEVRGLPPLSAAIS